MTHVRLCSDSSTDDRAWACGFCRERQLAGPDGASGRDIISMDRVGLGGATGRDVISLHTQSSSSGDDDRIRRRILSSEEIALRRDEMQHAEKMKELEIKAAMVEIVRIEMTRKSNEARAKKEETGTGYQIVRYVRLALDIAALIHIVSTVFKR